MSPDQLLRLLHAVAAGRSTPEEALERLRTLPFEALVDAAPSSTPFARLDNHRALRVGFPEVVYGERKSPQQIVDICHALARRSGGFLVTRADVTARGLLAEAFPAAEVNAIARTVLLHGAEAETPVQPDSSVLVVSAGTADLPVAEEAAVTAATFGNAVERIYDVGVAGLHRLLDHTEALRRPGVLIVVAGMEGALPSVVGGLVSTPVIAVPTSVGYGASFAGLAALLAMLNSCAAGVTVVNIDNGFGAACAATRINSLREGWRVSGYGSRVDGEAQPATRQLATRQLVDTEPDSS